MSSIQEVASRIGYKLREIRTNADLTQKEVAFGIGCSTSAIKNYELGASIPNLVIMLRYCKVCGVNFEHFIHTTIQPDYSPDNNIEEMRRQLSDYILYSATDWTVQLVYFNTLGSHGSSSTQQFNMLAMNNQCSMESRTRVARLISDNYAVEKSTGRLSNTNAVDVNDDALKDALSRGLNAAVNGDNGYV